MLHGIENQRGLDDAIRETVADAVRQLNFDADERSAARTGEINRNFELTNHEVQNIATELGHLRKEVAEVKALVPRITSTEVGLDRLREEMVQLRTSIDRRMTQLENDYRALRDQKNGTQPPTRPTATRKSNPGGG